jgi:hypothetical protein
MVDNGCLALFSFFSRAEGLKSEISNGMQDRLRWAQNGWMELSLPSSRLPHAEKSLVVEDRCGVHDSFCRYCVLPSFNAKITMDLN